MPIILGITTFGLVLLGFFRYFHRIPSRISTSSINEIISPADGKIWQIVPLNSEEEILIPKRFLGKVKGLCQDIENASWLVSIFMNPLDCHVNWSPLSGKVLSQVHTPGNFAFANTWESLLNEKNEIVIQGASIKLKMIQIAGFVARRIDSWIKKGEEISKGQPIGMIRLGSQVSLILPAQVALQVKVGEKVRGGETVIATFGSP